MHLTLPIPDDFSFLETMNAHGWRVLLPFAWHDGTQTLERIERLKDGRVVRMTLHAEADCVCIEVHETVDEAEVIGKVRRMLQLDLPVDRFHAFCDADHRLACIREKRQGRLLCSPTLWEDVCKVILTTNTTWTQTKLMTQRLVQSYGSPLASDPGCRAFPTPQQVAAVPFEEFAATARFGYRNASIHSLAGEICRNEIDLESLCNPYLPTPELWKRLLALRGVGPYAASCLMIYLGRYDRVNVDSWARMMVGKELGRPVTDKEVHAFFAPYGEWSGLVYHFYPWSVEEPAY